MPDLLAHLALGWVVAVALGITGPRRVVFLVGNVMPDLFRFVVLMVDALSLDALKSVVSYIFVTGAHSLLGVVAFSMLLSVFIHIPPLATEGPPARLNRQRRVLLGRPVSLLVLGGVVHLVLDTIMWPWTGGVPWLFPSMLPATIWSLRLVWPGGFEALLVLLPFLAAAFVYELVRHRRGGLQRRAPLVA